jgi:hypothetical protein
MGEYEFAQALEMSVVRMRRVVIEISAREEQFKRVKVDALGRRTI